MNKDIKKGDYVISLQKRKSRIDNVTLVWKGDIGKVVNFYPYSNKYDVDFNEGNNKKIALHGHWSQDRNNIQKIPDFLIPNIQAMTEYKEKPDIGDWVCVLDKDFDQKAFGLWGRVLSEETGYYFIDLSMNPDYKSPFRDQKSLLKSRKIRVIPALPNKEDSAYKQELKIGDFVSVLTNEQNYINKGMLGEIKRIKEHSLLIEFKKINNPKLDRDYIYPVAKTVKLKVISKLPDKEDSLKVSDLSIALSLNDYAKALEVLPAHPIFDSILRIRKESEKSQRFAKDYREISRKTKNFIFEIYQFILLDDMEAIANTLVDFKSYVETLPTDNLYLKK